MSFLQNSIYNYCESHSSSPDEILLLLERETHLTTMAPQMMSSHFQGKILYFFSKLINARNILEIGTFTGYSAICMARGLAEGGKLTTIEVNPELERIIRKYIRRAGLSDRIELIIDDAANILPQIDQDLDMVFIDAGKRHYKSHYEAVLNNIRSGGLIVIDNVLWSGKVLNKKKDKDSQEIDQFNTFLHQDNRVENILLPIRDGLMVALKK